MNYRSSGTVEVSLSNGDVIKAYYDAQRKTIVLPAGVADNVRVKYPEDCDVSLISSNGSDGLFIIDLGEYISPEIRLRQLAELEAAMRLYDRLDKPLPQWIEKRPKAIACG